VSVLVVGLSHKSAPVATLERAAVSGDALGKLLSDVAHLPDITEAFVISTCNRVEVYAEVYRFHGAVTGVCELLARYSGIQPGELTGSLYVHYEDRAVQHLLAVASGLDSMVVGEDQILGQVRTALKDAADRGTLGRTLRDLGRLALRTGKRARAETGIDRLGVSLVSVGIELATSALGRPVKSSPARTVPEPGQLLSGLEVLVVGAGAMSGLAVATAARSGAARIVVANRTREHADRLASGVGGEVADLASLTAAITAADLVISCTGASGLVISEPVVRAAAGRRESRPLVLLDLAMPHDVDRAVTLLPGVTVIGLDELRDSGGVAVGAGEMAAVRAIVEEEYAAYGSAVRAARVTPTVVALRTKAATVVDAELARLAGRLSEDGLSGRALEEVGQTVRRVVDKLLHAPTVRVKELASSPGGEEYAAALRVLFDLDPRAVEAVTRAEVETPNVTDQEGLRVKAETLRLGSRRSPMALAQSGEVARRITRRTGRPVEIVGVTTLGDVSGEHLTQIGGTGVFVSALRESLLRGEVDFAVHSLKDLPTGAAPGITLAAIPVRDDPRDALVARDGAKLADLPASARIGTGSPRRAAQIALLRADVSCVPIRGNANTRLAKVRDGELDAVVLAYAGLARLGLTELVTEIFEPDDIVPAPGQGALAVECRTEDTELIALLATIDHGPSRAAVMAERSLLAALEAGCSAPIGAYAIQWPALLRLRGVVLGVPPADTHSDGLDAAATGATMVVREYGEGNGADAARIGRELATRMLARGAADLISAKTDREDAHD
jgi:glutamyl-tRNA reductase